MPTWSPDWADVQFDLAAADAAAARLEALAGLLEEGHDVLGAHHWRVAVSWAGAHRTRHDAIAEDWARSGRVVVEDLRALARAVRSAMETATTEQRHRQADRERWLAEAAAEHAALRLASVPASASAAGSVGAAELVGGVP